MFIDVNFKKVIELIDLTNFPLRFLKLKPPTEVFETLTGL